MRYLTATLATIVFSLISLFNFATPAYAQFDPLAPTCSNAVDKQNAQAICNNSTNPGDPVNDDNGIVVKLANLLAFAAAIIAVVVVIVAGITMMTSEGDAGKVASSRNAIIYTVIGLIVIVMARTIVVYVMLRSATI